MNAKKALNKCSNVCVHSISVGPLRSVASIMLRQPGGREAAG